MLSFNYKILLRIMRAAAVCTSKKIILFVGFFVCSQVIIWLYMHRCDPDTSLFKTKLITFIESSGRTILRPRQACSVESAAKFNPDYEVRLYMSLSQDNGDEDLLLRSLKTDYGVKLIQLDAGEIFRGTKLQKWYEDKQIEKSIYKVAHLSDALRLALVWKHGGIYLDIDMITLKKFHMVHNFIAIEPLTNIDKLSNAIFGFSKGHRFLDMCMADIAVNFVPNHWSANGPRAVTRNLKIFCSTSSFMNVTPQKCGVQIFPSSFAYPVQYSNQRLLNATSDESYATLQDFTKTSTILHTYNSDTGEMPIYVGGNSNIEKFYKTQCPKTYENLIKSRSKSNL